MKSTTRRAYAKDWAHFVAWCADWDLPSLPSEPATVVAYLEVLGVGLPRCRQILSTITKMHTHHSFETPCKNSEVFEFLAAIPRKKSSRKVIDSNLLFRLLTALPDTVAGKRDRLLLLLGFSGALRRSEIVALTVEQVRVEPDGLVLLISEGDSIKIPRGESPVVCSVEAYQAWVHAAQIKTGALFRTVHWSSKLGPVLGPAKDGGKIVDRALKRALKSLGIDPAGYSAGSLRAGWGVEAAARSGKVYAAAQGRWRAISSIYRHLEKL